MRFYKATEEERELLKHGIDYIYANLTKSCLVYNRTKDEIMWNFNNRLDSSVCYDLLDAIKDALHAHGTGIPKITNKVIFEILSILKFHRENDISYDEKKDMISEFFGVEDYEDNDVIFGIYQYTLYMLENSNFIEYGFNIFNGYPTELGELYIDLYELSIEIKEFERG